MVTGLVGSGKTTFVVGDVVEPAVKRGQHVFHNLPLHMDACRLAWGADRCEKLLHKLPDSTDMGGLGKFLELDKLVCGGTADCPTLLVLDEAPDWLDSWGDKYSMQRMIDFLRFARHLHIDCYLLTQHPDLLQARVRCLVGSMLVVADGRKFRVPNTGIFAGLIIFNWPYWLCWEMSPSGKHLIRMSRKPKRKEVWKLFDSYARPGRYSDVGTVERYEEQKKAGWKMTGLQKAALYVCLLASLGSVGMIWSRQFEPRIIVREIPKAEGAKVEKPEGQHSAPPRVEPVVLAPARPSTVEKASVPVPADNRIRMLPGGVRVEYACPEQVWRDPDTVVWKFGRVRWLKGATGEYGKVADISEQSVLFVSSGSKTLVRRVDDPERATAMRRISLASSVPLPYNGNK